MCVEDDRPLLPSPSEREELARVIAGHTNLDWGAHNMTDLVDEEHESGEAETCEGCLKVADAVLAAGYSKRSSPSIGCPRCGKQGTSDELLGHTCKASPSSAGQEVTDG